MPLPKIQQYGLVKVNHKYNIVASPSLTKYESVITKHCSYSLLESLKHNMMDNLPRVSLYRLRQKRAFVGKAKKTHLKPIMVTKSAYECIIASGAKQNCELYTPKKDKTNTLSTVKRCLFSEVPQEINLPGSSNSHLQQKSNSMVNVTDSAAWNRKLEQSPGMSNTLPLPSRIPNAEIKTPGHTPDKLSTSDGTNNSDSDYIQSSDEMEQDDPVLEMPFKAARSNSVRNGTNDGKYNYLSSSDKIEEDDSILEMTTSITAPANSVPNGSNTLGIRTSISTKCATNIKDKVEWEDLPLPSTKRVYHENYEISTVPLATGRRTRQHFCIYCKKLYSKLPNHLESVHSDENAVKQIMSYPKGNPRRKAMLDTIRKEGDFNLNTNRLYNGGNIIVARRPATASPRDGEYYLPCPGCKLYLAKKSLSRHYKLCKQHLNKEGRTIIPNSRILHGQLHKNASSILRNRVFPFLMDDDVTKIVRFDELAIIYGNYLCTRYASSSHHDTMIRARLRGIGRLLIEAKNINSAVRDFSTLMSPPFFDTVIASIQKVAGLDETGQKFRAPATASSLVMLIKAAADIWKSESIKREDIESVKRTDRFLSLFKTESAAVISKTVVENQIEMQRRKSVQLPNPSDLDLFSRYVRDNRKRYLAEVCEPNTSFSYSSWKNLSSFTMISILIFNRRRPGEIQRIKLVDYKTLQVVNENTTSDFHILSAKEKQLANLYVRFQIRGKLNRTVPVLLSRGIKSALDTIIQYRKQAGVDTSNPYVFGLPGGHIRHTFLNAYELVRQYASACGATNSFNLRATQLRKHIATYSLNLDLSENEVQQLADSMGHAKDIHKAIYRQPVHTRDICRVTRILKAAQGNATDDENADSAAEQDSNKLSSQSTEPENQFLSTRLISPVTNNFTERNNRKCHAQQQGDDRPWTSKEKSAASAFFAHHLKSKMVPSYNECQKALETVPELYNRSLPAIRMYICNNLKLPKTPKKMKYKEFASTGARKRWDTPSKAILFNIFADHLANGTLPSLAECRIAMEKYPVLENRTAACLKTAINNELNRRCR